MNFSVNQGGDSCCFGFRVGAGIARSQATADYLKKLQETGILSVRKVGKEYLYLNTKLYEIVSKQNVDANDIKTKRVDNFDIFRHILISYP